MAKKKKQQVVVANWLSRDKYGNYYDLHKQREKPQSNENGQYGGIISMCYGEWENHTGIVLKPGACRRVKLTMEY